MGSGFSKKKKQARALQDQFSKLQANLQNAEAIGSAGNGLVTVTLSGDHELKQIKIKPDCVDAEDIEGLEDLIKAAFADASKKLKEESVQAMPGLPAGFPNLGGFGL